MLICKRERLLEFDMNTNVKPRAFLTLVEDERILPFWLDFHKSTFHSLFVNSSPISCSSKRDDIKRQILIFFPDCEFWESSSQSGSLENMLEINS